MRISIKIIFIFIVSTISNTVNAKILNITTLNKYKFMDIPGRNVTGHIYKVLPFLSAKKIQILNGKILFVSDCTPAKVNQFPHQAALFFNNENFCGGSLIHPFWILTAAHCMEGATQAEVILASLDGENGKSFESEKLIPNEQYDPVKIEHDIALVKLKSEVPISAKDKSIKVIGLQQKWKSCSNLIPKLIVSGWGSTNATNMGSLTLQWATLAEISNLKCFQTYGINKVPPTVLCALGKNGETSCTGDSGGPVIVMAGYSCIQVGIVSFGGTCGDGNPVAFTRVSLYMNWITATTGLSFK